MRYILLIIVWLLTTAGAVHGQFGRIYLGSVDGLINGRMPFEPVTFHFHYENYIAASVRGMVNGFRLSATGGVTWAGSYAMDPTFPVDNFDLAFSMAPYSWDGYDADTVAVGGAVAFGAGLPPLFHGPAVDITVDIDNVNSFNGETFCVDSASFYYSPWLWTYPSYVGSLPPAWDGPHCFLIVDSGGPFESFEVVANGNGPVDPPQSAALGSVGFPTPGNANPGSDQQAGAGKWAFHTVDNGGSSGGGSLGSYGAFLDRTLRNDNELDVMDMEFEMRFTESSGSWAIRAFTDGAAVWVPFELWRIGHCTPDDPSDDVRMSVWMLEHADNGVYDLENWGTSGNGGGEFEHSSSPGNDDPYTDWIYWVLPADSTPGQSGYLADEAAIRAGTYGYDGEEVMARTVLINVDGGSGPSFNQDRPEDGTIFRITGRNSIPCGCCIGMTGNVDNDTDDVTDIGDLTALIDFLFISFEPPVCMEEANADGAGDVDIGDLTRLINFLFISFDPPADCT